MEGIEKSPPHIAPTVSSHIMHLSGEELWRTGNGSEIWRKIEEEKKQKKSVFIIQYWNTIFLTSVFIQFLYHLHQGFLLDTTPV